jgi:hypothetical protein
MVPVPGERKGYNLKNKGEKSYQPGCVLQRRDTRFATLLADAQTAADPDYGEFTHHAAIGV